MLMIFNLDWPQFSIDYQVSEANRFMRGLAESIGVSNKVIFNCASLGTGEHVLPFSEPERVLTPDELGYLRWHHHHVREAMQQGRPFRINRETSEMFQSLRKFGHSLAAVWTGATAKLEEGLIQARCRDYFEDRVFGYDRLSERRGYDLTGKSLYSEALYKGQTAPQDAIIVSDHPEGVEDAKLVRPQAVVGYVSSNEEDKKKGLHMQELKGAGADCALFGGSSVAIFPEFLGAVAERRAAHTQLKSMIDQIMKKDLQ